MTWRSRDAQARNWATGAKTPLLTSVADLQLRIHRKTGTGREQYEDAGASAAPDAKTVLITFPLTAPGASEALYRNAARLHPARDDEHMGCMRSCAVSDDAQVNHKSSRQRSINSSSLFNDLHSQLTRTDRANAEVELLALSAPTTAARFATGSRTSPRRKMRWQASLHLIHGLDLACARGRRALRLFKGCGAAVLLTAGRVYDWWDLASALCAAEEPVWNDHRYTPQGKREWAQLRRGRAGGETHFRTPKNDEEGDPYAKTMMASSRARACMYGSRWQGDGEQPIEFRARVWVPVPSSPCVCSSNGCARKWG
ncbi:hypothetical protein B0H14DRAFT_3483256 [Mycena olivaceomarginata]|nr:hypothetical protein B0H14DRAFT_3483256 [Mycena olivaceomarginata]